MPDYKKMYFSLFNAVTDALAALVRGEEEAAQQLLRQAQLAAEERYLSAGDPL